MNTFVHKTKHLIIVYEMLCLILLLPYRSQNHSTKAFLFDIFSRFLCL